MIDWKANSSDFLGSILTSFNFINKAKKINNNNNKKIHVSVHHSLTTIKGYVKINKS